MNIYGENRLFDFYNEHADSKSAILTWLFVARAAGWNSPQDIKNQFPKASIIPNNTIIFNIKGNKYRLEVQFNYSAQFALITWIGTHAEYDKRNRKRR